MNRFVPAFAAPILLAASATLAVADEAAEKYVDDALPLLYHTCESVVVEADGDEGYIDTVIRAHVALSLYNRDIDVTAVEITDARKDELQAKFVEALRQGCERDQSALLAGVIDRAVAHAVSGEAPEAYIP